MRRLGLLAAASAALVVAMAGAAGAVNEKDGSELNAFDKLGPSIIASDSGISSGLTKTGRFSKVQITRYRCDSSGNPAISVDMSCNHDAELQPGLESRQEVAVAVDPENPITFSPDRTTTSTASTTAPEHGRPSCRPGSSPRSTAVPHGSTARSRCAAATEPAIRHRRSTPSTTSRSWRSSRTAAGSAVPSRRRETCRSVVRLTAASRGAVPSPCSEGTAQASVLRTTRSSTTRNGWRSTTIRRRRSTAGPTSPRLLPQRPEGFVRREPDLDELFRRRRPELVARSGDLRFQPQLHVASIRAAALTVTKTNFLPRSGVGRHCLRALLNSQNAAAWEVPNDMDSQIMVTRSSDGGATRSAPVAAAQLEDGFSDMPYSVIGSTTIWGHQLRWDPAGNISVNPNNPRDVTVVWSDRGTPKPERNTGLLRHRSRRPAQLRPVRRGPELQHERVHLTVARRRHHVVGSAASTTARPATSGSRGQTTSRTAPSPWRGTRTYNRPVLPHGERPSSCTYYGHRAASSVRGRGRSSSTSR